MRSDMVLDLGDEGVRKVQVQEHVVWARGSRVQDVIDMASGHHMMVLGVDTVVYEVCKLVWG